MTAASASDTRRCVVDNIVYPAHSPVEGRMRDPATDVAEDAVWCSRCGARLDRRTGKELTVKR